MASLIVNVTDLSADISYQALALEVDYQSIQPDIFLDYDSINQEFTDELPILEVMGIHFIFDGIVEPTLLVTDEVTLTPIVSPSETLTASDAFDRTVTYFRNFTEDLKPIDYNWNTDVVGPLMNGAPFNSNALLLGGPTITTATINPTHLESQQPSEDDFVAATDVAIVNTFYNPIYTFNGDTINTRMLN